MTTPTWTPTQIASGEADYETYRQTLAQQGIILAPWSTAQEDVKKAWKDKQFVTEGDMQ